MCPDILKIQMQTDGVHAGDSGTEWLVGQLENPSAIYKTGTVEKSLDGRPAQHAAKNFPGNAFGNVLKQGDVMHFAQRATCPATGCAC